MIDVRGDDGAAASHFVPDEFGGNLVRQARTEGLSGMLVFQQTLFPGLLQLHVFTDGDVLHLRGHDTLPGVVHLGNVLARFGP